ncbi:MAG TPA: glutamine synthetase family protein [Chloroflexota bacterium]|nr:glutamine synthetase family protein [Chloroflexota bacterium]
MAEQPLTAEGVRALIAEHNVDTVKIGAPDLDGIYRGKRIPATAFLDGLNRGFAQCDVVFGWDINEDLVPGLRFTGWETGYPDMLAHPDLATFKLVPWEDRVASVVCDYADEHGHPIRIAPRHVLRRVLERAASLGYRAELAMELEFRIFREDQRSLRAKGWQDLEPLSPTTSCYSIHRASGDDFLLGRIRRMMDAYAIPIEGYNREHGPGMYEMNLGHAPGVTAADHTMLFRNGVKEICLQEGMTATFMAKWHDQEDGSSGHLHQSLWSLADAHNLFYEAGGTHGFSDLAYHYAAGVLHTLPEFCALYASTINSYKRFVAGTWAPTSVTWGVETRTTAVRLVPGTAGSTRIENRVPGADANPYLALAAAVAGGLHGIEQRLSLPPPARGNAYALSTAEAPPLPRTLEAAVERFAESALARHYFGEEFVEHFVAMRRWEVQQYHRVVDRWQRERYLEMI